MRFGLSTVPHLHRAVQGGCHDPSVDSIDVDRGDCLAVACGVRRRWVAIDHRGWRTDQRVASSAAACRGRRSRTGDRAAVLAVAQTRGVSGVVAFGSDVMAVEAAWVAEQLGLPANPSHAMEIMGRKDLFRDFLAGNGFPVPGSRSVDEMTQVEWPSSGLRLPVIVKPVDAAGSTAVTRVDCWEDLPPAFAEAQSASRSRRVIVEEFIIRTHPHMIAGDAFVVDGKGRILRQYIGAIREDEVPGLLAMLETGK